MSEPSVSLSTYRKTAVALFVLLGATMGAAMLPLGAFSPVVALAIASAKAVLVVLYFMHVRYASPLARLFAASGLIWLLILFTLTLADFLTRPG